MTPISDEKAFSVVCPMCHAKKGDPCTYLTTKFIYEREPQPWAGRWPRTKKILVAEIGSPTKMPHIQRRDLVWRKEERDRLKAYWAEVTKPPAALFALRDFDLAEYNATRDWLREHGHILWEPAPRYYDRWEAVPVDWPRRIEEMTAQWRATLHGEQLRAQGAAARSWLQEGNHDECLVYPCRHDRGE